MNAGTEGGDMLEEKGGEQERGDTAGGGRMGGEGAGRGEKDDWEREGKGEGRQEEIGCEGECQVDRFHVGEPTVWICKALIKFRSDIFFSLFFTFPFLLPFRNHHGVRTCDPLGATNTQNDLIKRGEIRNHM